ncbi:MAG: DnaA/Hda family protein, partial [Planctomycetota bacterium]|nr:DnaA/Hda family protein [Planctomycetota bacterium]
MGTNGSASRNGSPWVDDGLPGKPGPGGAFRLEEFAVGQCNRVSYLAACQVMDRNPRNDFCSPLFLYGKAGVGKTHLIQGIYRSYHKRYPRNYAFHVTGEQFSNSFRASLRNGNVAEFRNRYRRLNLLLVDDIQALAGKAATQVEFLYTFEELHRMGSRVVLAADRHPNQMHSIKSSLLGRFQGGFVVRLDSPDQETRLSILRTKCKKFGRKVSNDVLQLLVRDGGSNVREIVGALTKIIAHATLCHEDVDLALARRVLDGLRSARPKQVTFRQIERSVTRYF